jgi:hypothetical protein
MLEAQIIEDKRPRQASQGGHQQPFALVDQKR